MSSDRSSTFKSHSSPFYFISREHVQDVFHFQTTPELRWPYKGPPPPSTMVASNPLPPPPPEMQIASPIDLREFSTPPTTPSAIHNKPSTMQQQAAARTLSRRSSRPQMIQIAQPEGQYHLDTVIGTPNLDLQHLPSNHILHSLAPALQGAHIPGDGTVASAVPHRISSPKPHTLAPKSPCFVHSLLDKGISLTDWLRETTASEPPVIDSQQDRDSQNRRQSQTTSRSSSSITSSPSQDGSSLGFIPSPTEFDDDEDSAGNLTRQLAATAIGVREMSKQLGTSCRALFCDDPFSLASFSRPCPSPIQHPKCYDNHEGAGQPSHQADSGPLDLLDEQACPKRTRSNSLR